MKYNIDDTIAAISTPVGEGGIGIVRLSGRDSLSIACKIFKSKNGESPSWFKSHTTHYGHITSSPQDIVDEVILTVMRSPKSYTKEDIVEINCHGGIVPLKNVLQLVLSSGARLAQPGEFTMRAFLNGRIDLAQAESVLDIISSKTDTSLRAAMGQLAGRLSETVKSLREDLMNLMTHIDASIDFPEEDIEILSNCRFKEKIEEALNRLKTLIESAQKGRILREGIRTVICGKPNVGKSSLMNSLLKEKRVIVSHLPGTTRDTIEEIINIDGIPLKIVDTAGIIESEDLLTREGVARSRFYIKTADLVLFLLDGSRPLCENDKIIMDEIKDRKKIIVINKTDLPNRLELAKIRNTFQDKAIIKISVKDNKNLKELEDAISDMVWGGRVTADHTTVVTSARHKALLVQSRRALKKALNNLKENVYPEFTALNMKEAIDSLGGITGETIDDDILNKIFSNFCIGK